MSMIIARGTVLLTAILASLALAHPLAAQPGPEGDITALAQELGLQPAGQQHAASVAHAPLDWGPVPIWWWSGDRLSMDRLVWQMDRMKEGGLRNAVLLNLAPSGPLYGSDPDDPPFFSEQWWDILERVLQEAEQREMHIWLYDQLGFSGAGLQAKVVARNAEAYAGWRLGLVEADTIGGPVHLDLPAKAQLVFAAAYPVADGLLSARRAANLSAAVGEGGLDWQAPPGQWKVMLFYSTRSGFDYLSKAACAQLIDDVHGEYERRIGRYLGNVVPGTFQDELPGHQNWTGDFVEQFRNRHNYDLRPFLAALFHDIGRDTPKVRCDYFDTAAALAEQALYIPLNAWHDKFGMICGIDQSCRTGDPIQGQSLYFDYFRTQRWFGAPGNDQNGNTKVNSSLAHIYDRPRVWQEGYYNSGWGQTLEDLLGLINSSYVDGGTLYNPHAWYYSTRGAWWEWAPPCTSFRQPYWEHYPVLARYVSRLSYLLTRGEHVCDVAVLYPSRTIQAETTLSGGPSAEARATNAAFWEVVRSVREAGYDLDVVDEESLQRGYPYLAGERYRCLILPRVRTITEETAQTLNALKEWTGVVVYQGLPTATDYAGRRDRVLNPWRMGGASDRSALVGAVHGKADRSVTTTMRYLHRRIGEVDVYFLPHAKPGDTLTFNATGEPALWDLYEGTITRPTAWRRVQTGTEVCLDFEGGPGIVVAFAPKQPEAPAAHPATLEPMEVVEIEGDWQCRLYPTMDNRWGDFELPPSEGPLPVDCRRFRYRQEAEDEDGLALGWHQAEFDDSQWQEVTYSVGPRCLVTNPLPESFESPPDGPWSEYWFSTRFGIEDDPVAGRPLGPKGHVHPEFIDLGKAQAGRVRYVKTWLISDRGQEAQLNVGAQSPKTVWLNGQPVTQQEQTTYHLAAPVSLREGRNEFVLRLQHQADRSLRAYFFFTRRGKAPARATWIWNPELGEAVGECFFRRTFHLRTVPDEATIWITCDNGYYLYLNGKQVGSDEGYGTEIWSRAEKYDVRRYLRRGANVIAVRATNLGGPAGLAAIAKLDELELVTDISWRTTLSPDEGWQQLRYDDSGWDAPRVLDSLGAGRWGPIANMPGMPGLGPTLPDAFWLENEPRPDDFVVVGLDVAPKLTKRSGWYRLLMPPGAMEMHLDMRAQGVRVWIDRRARSVLQGRVSIADGPGKGPRVATIRVVGHVSGERGGAPFHTPIRFRCAPGTIPLGSWHELGLQNYSGGLIYYREVTLPDGFAGRRVVLDLGKVRGTAEVSVNARRAGVRIAAPYRFDLTDSLRPRRNRLEIKVLGTLGPHYKIANPTPYVYPGQEVTGLFGPVRLLAYDKP